MGTREEELMKRLLAIFRTEADEHIAAMGSGLLALEHTVEAEARKALIEQVYREAHSLKGASRAVNRSDIEQICGAMESVFSGLKAGELELTTVLIDLLLFANDLLTKVLQAGEAELAGDADVIDELIHDLGLAEAGELPSANVAARHGTMRGNLPARTLEAEQVPPEHAPVPAARGAAEGSAPVILASIPQAAAIPPTAAVHPIAAKGAETVRVQAGQLDSLLLQAGELLTVRMSLGEKSMRLANLGRGLQPTLKQFRRATPLLRQLEEQVHGLPGQHGREMQATIDQLAALLRQTDAELTGTAEQLQACKVELDRDQRGLAATTRDLLGGMRRLVMMPFATMLGGFAKMVRDIARDHAKEITFQMHGEEIEADKRILEAINAPLNHLVRNALDHGIESPAERRAAGKPQGATLSITISQQHRGKLEIAVADDGRGIEPARIRASAVRKGIISAAEAEQLSDEESVGLIFASGFSTSDIITDLSGRGLGMAIVREKVEQLGGDLHIENAPGRGIVFRLRLPTSLATFQAILVRASGQMFMLPTLGVERTLRVARSALRSVAGQICLAVDDRETPFVPLSRLLDLPPEKTEAGQAWQKVLILHAGDARLAIGVEEVLTEQEVLVKDLGPQLPRVRNIAGATILGTGKIIPILSIGDLISSAGGKGAAAPAGLEDQTRTAVSILVVDDSMTTRSLLKNVLESAGYRVTTAVDGVEAFEKLGLEAFDLLVSDVEMPRMNGFELCRRVRDDAALGELPVVLCTSLGSARDKQQGIDAGANAYIVKSNFEQGSLLEIIANLV